MVLGVAGDERRDVVGVSDGAGVEKNGPIGEGCRTR
jgi:hypothetical protein